jgi:hypothetical protein
MVASLTAPMSPDHHAGQAGCQTQPDRPLDTRIKGVQLLGYQVIQRRR